MKITEPQEKLNALTKVVQWENDRIQSSHADSVLNIPAHYYILNPNKYIDSWVWINFTIKSS